MFIWLSYSIYREIKQQPHLETSWLSIKASFTGPRWWMFVCVVLLMLCNWGIEALKWQVLVSGIQKVSFGRAFRAVFSGQALALNTINRVGEYVGRVVYLEEGNRLRAVAVSLVGSMAQIIVTFVMGIIGLIYMRYNILDATHHLEGLSVFWLNGLMYILSAGVLVLVLLYFRLSWLTKMAEKIPIVAKYAFYIQKLEDFHPKELTRILVLSFIRYAVFILQYLLLLSFFEVDVSWWQAGWMVCVMFLVLAVVPTISSAELGLRGEASKQLLGLLSANTLGIVVTATAIWLINLIIPALAGSLFILGIRLFRNK